MHGSETDLVQTLKPIHPARPHFIKMVQGKRVYHRSLAERTEKEEDRQTCQ